MCHSHTFQLNSKMLLPFSFLLFVHRISTTKYYTTYELKESGYLCELLHMDSLKFGDGIENALRFKFYSKKRFHCQFDVIPRSVKHGVVAVIQDMNFRVDKATGRCIDYIMFQGNKFGGVSKKFCGNFDAELAMEKYVYQGDSYVAMETRNTYQTIIEDSITVIVHMNLNCAHCNDTGAELVLTSYTDCRKKPPWFYKPCVADNLDTLCIEDVYFGDGVINCPFKGCVDEGTCVPFMVKFYGKRMFIGAMVGIFFCICLSAAFFYFCTPMKNYTGQTDPPPNYMLPPFEEEETEGDVDEEQRRPDDIRREEPMQNWDKPPMYETLFPNMQSPFAQV